MSFTSKPDQFRNVVVPFSSRARWMIGASGKTGASKKRRFERWINDESRSRERERTFRKKYRAHYAVFARWGSRQGICTGFDIPRLHSMGYTVTVFEKNAVYEAMITIAIAVEKDYRNRGTWNGSTYGYYRKTRHREREREGSVSPDFRKLRWKVSFVQSSTFPLASASRVSTFRSK